MIVPAELLSLFNIDTLENDLKWRPLPRTGTELYDRAAQEATDWLLRHNIRSAVTCWWGRLGNLPKFMRSSRRTRRNSARKRKSTFVRWSRPMKGRLVHWDTLNEPFDNQDLLDILGKEVPSNGSNLRVIGSKAEAVHQ
jgi:hypothetical protein